LKINKYIINIFMLQIFQLKYQEFKDF
jgi:hypothetical protein